MKVEKACPVVTRPGVGAPEVLAFVHPLAGRQFVKGSVELGEPPQLAAARELFEESGLVVPEPMNFLGAQEIGDDRILWHIFHHRWPGLPERWDHWTEDDNGHTFSFFWHSVKAPLTDDWHPIFHQALAFFGPRIPRD